MRIVGIEIEQRSAAVLTRAAGYFAGGFLAAACSLDGRAPLAAALAAAVGGKAASGAVLCGGIVGAFTFLSFAAGIRCCGILTLIAAVLSAFRDTPWIRRPIFRPMTAAICTFAVELVCALQLGLSPENLLRLLSCTALAALLCHYWVILFSDGIMPRRREKRESEKIRERLRLGAQALRTLGESIGGGVMSTEENPAVIFDRAAEVVCRGCALCELCWSREYISTFNAFNDATPAILERGRAESGDFALHFASRCIHFPQFVAAVNAEVSAHLMRRQYRRRIEAERRRTRGQYAQLSELMVQALSAPEHEEDEEHELPYDVAMGSAAKEGQRVCGDSATHFKGGGKLHLLLSDGMGSGLEAQRESRLALRLAQQFLTAGIEAACALRTINAALNLRSDEQGGFTTIDLLSVDLSSYQATLSKYGAAPTYIKRHGSVRRLTGSALPAGLQEPGSKVPVTEFSLEEGSFVLMISDGVADSGDDKWLQDLLAGWQGRDPDMLVSLMLKECRQRRNGDDDCSALCLYLPTRNRGRREV